MRDAEVEPSIAADPARPDALIGAWQQDRDLRGGAAGIESAASTDGGRTWKEALVPGLTKCSNGPYIRASDPWVSAGPGRAYLGTIGIRDDRTGAVLVSTTTDGGATWTEPATVANGHARLIVDKESVLADRSDGSTAYVVWVDYAVTDPKVTPHVNAARFSRTGNGGRTWSTPGTLYSGNTETQFHTLAQLSDGTLLDFFAEAKSLSGNPNPPLPARIAVVRSSDEGRTWSRPTSVARFTFATLRTPSSHRAVRATTANISAATGPDGTAFVAWADQVTADRWQIRLVRSRDGGTTWEPRVTVAEPSGQAFLPTVAVAGDGRVGVTWYEDRSARSSPGEGVPTKVRLAWSGDDGATWHQLDLGGPPFDLDTARLSSEGDFVGDYEGLAGLPSGFSALFVQARPRSRAGPTDVFFARVDLAPE